MKVIPLINYESQLIARAIKNNREAQRCLYDLHSGKMLSLCRMYIKDLHHAEEVMLNGFFKVFKHLAEYRKEGSFQGWIRKIMIRECISFLRKEKSLEFKEEAIEDFNGSFNNIESDINVEEIQQLIDSLPEGYRLVFSMYAIEGYKHQEISKMLNINKGTSKSQLFKARRMLQEKLRTQNISGYGAVKI